MTLDKKGNPRSHQIQIERYIVTPQNTLFSVTLLCQRLYFFKPKFWHVTPNKLNKRGKYRDYKTGKFSGGKRNILKTPIPVAAGRSGLPELVSCPRLVLVCLGRKQCTVLYIYIHRITDIGKKSKIIIVPKIKNAKNWSKMTRHQNCHDAVIHYFLVSGAVFTNTCSPYHVNYAVPYTFCYLQLIPTCYKI